jgi:hypothetical protein
MASGSHKGLGKGGDDARQTGGAQPLQSEHSWLSSRRPALQSCGRLDFVGDGQIEEHVPRGTGIDHNCLRVEFVISMVRGHNG